MQNNLVKTRFWRKSSKFDHLCSNEFRSSIYREQLEEEDAALQKYHQAAVEGKYRTKRRGGGLAMSDSDSDFEDDDEARRLRRRMNKRRRIEGDTLEALGLLTQYHTHLYWTKQFLI